MERCIYGVVAIAACSLLACGNSAGSSGASAGASTSAGASSGGSSSEGGSMETGSSGAPPMTAPGRTPSAMPIISHGVPAFASNSDPASKPGDSNDSQPSGAWTSAAVPVWLAYDLSGVPVAQRNQVLVAWYDGLAADYINANADASKSLPVDYTLEINAADGGGKPPTDGWSVVDTVTGNDRSSRQRLITLGGANWLRMNVSKSSNPKATHFDLDVHSAPDGATDSWLFMGDSITFLSTTYAFSDLPKLVNDDDSGRWPALIGAAEGGTNTTSALTVVGPAMDNYPGRFVVLAYGTNDHATEFHMEELVQAVIAAGKVPVVPHMPWSATSGIQTDGPLINAQIDALYQKYPEILPGPDLWAFFTNRTDLIPATDIHPNTVGQEELRKQWALIMTKK
jgi:hypothetical protein